MQMEPKCASFWLNKWYLAALKEPKMKHGEESNHFYKIDKAAQWYSSWHYFSSSGSSVLSLIELTNQC